MKLFRKSSYLTLAATAALALTVSTANAQVTETVDASVAVMAPFTLTETLSLDFGEIVAARRGGGGGATSTLTVDPDTISTTSIANAGAATDDFIIENTPGSRAEITVAGAINGSTLQIEFPATPTTLTCGTCTGGNPTFVVDNYTDDGGDLQVTIDGSGDGTFYIGADLTTVAGTAVYETGTYAGTFDVVVTY